MQGLPMQDKGVFTRRRLEFGKKFDSSWILWYNKGKEIEIDRLNKGAKKRVKQKQT